MVVVQKVSELMYSSPFDFEYSWTIQCYFRFYVHVLDVGLILIKDIYFDVWCYSARQKLDEDLIQLDRQLKLQAGEEVPKSPMADERPADAYMAPMVSLLEYIKSLIIYSSTI